MNLFSKIAVCAITFSGMFAADAETVDLTEKNYFRTVSGGYSVAENQFTTRGMTFIQSIKPFDIDPAKQYSFKMTVNGSIPKDCRIYVGYNLYGADGKGYQAASWQGLPLTLTQLSRAAKKGDTVIYAKNAANWSLGGTVFIALDAKEDGSDLPNMKIINNSVKDKKKVGNEWEVTLREPLKADIPADMNIRQHVSGGYYYIVIKNLKAADSGKDIVLTGTVKGYNKTVAPFTGKNWPIGVTKARLLILADWGSKSGAVLTFKDASFVIE